MRIRKLLVPLFAALLVASLSLTRLAAQTETGQIAGTVTDPSGAFIPNAQVTATNLGTNGVRSTVTGADGSFLVPNLLPANYMVKVVAQGFKASEQPVEVTPGAKVGVDIKLEVGQSTTTVEVSGSAAAVLINTETQTVSQVIDSQMITQLPLFNLNPYNLVVASGNVSEDDPAGRGVGYAINGMRSETTNILLDGSANNDEFVAGVGQNVPVDSVQEYSLLTSNFTSEYGRAGGGIVNLTTKGGSNVIHGTGYEYNRVSKLASNDFYNNANGLAKGIYTRNQFGYSVGGPIKKDKLFFFESTEWTRIRSSSPQIAMVPDPAFIALANQATQAFFTAHGALRSGLATMQTYTRQDLENQGFHPCGGSLPGYFTGADPCTITADEAGSAQPSGGLLESTPMFDQVTYNLPADAGGGSPQNTYDLVGRADWNLSSKTQIYGRYARYSEFDLQGTTSNSPYAGYDTTSVSMDNNILLSVTHVFSPTTVSQSKLVFNRLNLLQPLGTTPASPTLYFSPTTTTYVLNHAVALPGYLPYSPGNGIPFGGPQNFLQFYEDMSKVKGKNDFRFGGSFNYLRDNRTFGAYETPGAALSTSGVNRLGTDDFLDGLLHQFQAAVDPQGKYPCAYSASGAIIQTPACTLTLPVSQPNFSRSNRYNEGALYGQDAWKVTPHVTLNLGVRWEYFGSQHNQDPNLDSNFYPNTGEPNVFLALRDGNVATTPTSPIGGLWAKHWANFGPRLGFAWDVFGDGKTSVRGGWGISYIRNFGNVTFNVIQNPPAYAVISLIGGLDLPQASMPIPTDLMGPLAGSSGTKALPSVSLRAVDPHIAQAYAEDFDFGVQREVVRNVVLDVTYSGSKGVHLYDIANRNRYGSGNVYLGDPCSEPGSYPDCYRRLASTQYTNVNWRGSGGFSTYNSLNTRLSIRNIKGVNFTVNYTYAHAIDDLSDTFSSSGNDYNLGYLDAFNPKVDRGDAQFDNRHRIAISGVWMVPFAKSTHGAVKQIFDGWSFAPIITARTGNPYSIFDCTMAVTVCMRMAETTAYPRSPQKPVATGIPDDYSMLNLCSGAPSDFTGCSFDSSYVNPIVGYSDFGPFPSNMTGRDAFRTPGDWNIDFAIHKNFPLTEKYNLEFRAEMFNGFNHANLYGGTGNAEVETLPYIGASYYGHRNIQLAIRFAF